MSNQTSPRNYFEADRVGAFRYGRPPSDWTHNEIVQIDLPSGYRCHVVTRLSNYQFDGQRFIAETTYLGRTIRFAQVGATVEGQALEDWMPVSATGQRVKLILPQIEYRLLTNNKNKQRLIFKGEGILRSTMGYSVEGAEFHAVRDNYTKPTELKSWLIQHYEKKYSIPWIHEGRALLHAVAAEHNQIVYAQGKDLSW
jgi:hypothetical protein